MPPRKAQTISLASVSRAVNAAVKVAAARHELAVDNETLLDRWELIGRRLRDVTDLNVAYKFAQDVSGRVNISGLKIDPVVTRIGNDILVGFVERGSLPRVLPR
jgi:hypothetical protein